MNHHHIIYQQHAIKKQVHAVNAKAVIGKKTARSHVVQVVHYRIIQTVIKKAETALHVKAVTGMHSVIPHVQLDVRTHNVINYQVIVQHVTMVIGVRNVNLHVHQDVKLQHAMLHLVTARNAQQVKPEAIVVKTVQINVK